MINCPITQQPLEDFYKYVYRAINDKLKDNKTFDVNQFMEDLFKKSSEKSDPETAAKWLQSTPRVINLIVTKSFSDKIPLVKGLDGIYGLMTDFAKPDGEGVKNVLAKYVKKKDVKDLKPVAAHQLSLEFSTEEDEPEGEGEEIPKNPPSVTARLKSTIPFSGTLPSFTPVDPKQKTDTYIERLDRPRAQIMTNLVRLSNAFNATDPFSDFVYQNKKIKVKAVNLYGFSQQNFNDLDPTTQEEIRQSGTMVAIGRAQANVTQADKRVLLVVTDEAGENLYFDEDGNITSKGNGKLLYQFMRDVRQTSKGYVVTDIYGAEEQLMPISEYVAKNYNSEIDGDLNTFTEKVKDQRQKELKRLFDLREKALGSEVTLDFEGLTEGVSSEVTATKLPLSDFLRIPGATKASLKTIRTLKKAEGKFYKGYAVMNLNGTDFQVRRSSMPDSVADQIAAVMFDPNIPFETKKDFYSQFIPEDSETKLAYTMRKHEIIPNMEKKSFRIRLFDNVGEKEGFMTEPTHDFVISAASLKRASAETLANGIKLFSDILKTGRSNGKSTYMSYKSDLLNSEDYFVYNTDTKQIEVGNYMNFLSGLDGYVMLVDGDPGFYNKTLLFSEPTELSKDLKEKPEAEEDWFEREIREAREYAEKQRALENANKTPVEIEFDFVIDRALSPEYKAQLEQQGVKAKSNNYFYAASLIQSINTDRRYTRELAEQLKDMLAGYIGGLSSAQTKTINSAIESAFPQLSTPVQNAVDIVQKTIEPEMPDPTTGVIEPTSNLTQDEQDALDEFGLFRAGYIADEVGAKDLKNVLNWWNKTKIGKELQKHITLEHAYNLVNSDVFAKFVVSGATLTNPDIKAQIQINPSKGTMVDIYHEAFHAFTQLYLTRQEKYNLYDEVINYKDANGKQPYKNLSYKEVDELLAEDFRTYMKTNYIKKGSPVRNRLFRKILNILRSLFGLKAINPTEVITDTMNVPAVRELFENLNYSSNKKSFVRKYQANINNVDWFELNRGISKLNRPTDTALSTQDSQLISDSMDMIISDIVDDYYRARLKTGNTTNLKSGTIGLLLDPEKRHGTYKIIQRKLKKKLDEFKDKLHSQPGITPFSEIKKLVSTDPKEKTIETEAVAVMKSSKGEDKYIFLKSQIDGFENLNPEIQKGTRVKGESWRGIKIVGDFYSHKSIKKDNVPVSIVVVSSLEDARQQFENYVAGGDKEYTDFEEKDVPDYMLSAEQELLLDNVRILQAALDNYGDPEWELKGIPATGTIAFHLQNSDFDISKTKYDLDKSMLNEEGEEEDEQEKEQSHDSETPFGGEASNKKSLLQLASKEVIYILKSLSKVDRDGEVSYNRLGFKERADFRKVWNIVTKTIGGLRDRVDAFEKLTAEAKNFPEIAQLIETKLPDPKSITSIFEQGVSNSFWQTFAKPSIKLWQFTAFPQYQTVINELTGETETVIGGYEAEVTQSSIEVDSTVRRFEALFKSSVANDYIDKTSENQSQLKLANLVKGFENKSNPGQLDNSRAFEFAAVLGMKLDDLPVIRKSLETKSDYYGLPYIYDIAKDFLAIQSAEKKTPQQEEFLSKFISNPIGTLRGEIPKGVLKTFKKDVSEKNILKRLAELQSQYGYDSANPGVLLPDGNRVFENVNHSEVTVTVDALNRVNKLSDLWESTEFSYMDHLKPGKSFFTLRSKVFGALFDMSKNTSEEDLFDKKSNRSLELIQTAGTQIADVEGVNTSDLDKAGKFMQEFHTFLLNGVAEFIRHAEKKSAFGIRQVGGKQKVIVNGITNGVDQSLYIDMDKFKRPGETQLSPGEIVAVGGYFLDYIAVEFDRIRYFKQNPNDLETIKGYNREIKDEQGNVIARAGELFTVFDNILRDKTKKDLYKLAEDPVLDLPTYVRNNQELFLKIQTDITDYFNENLESLTENYVSNMTFMDEKLYEKAGISENERKGGLATDPLVRAYLYNDWIHKFEMFNIFNGDASQFNHDKQEVQKRAPGSTSDGDGFLNDKYMHEFINKIFNNKTYAKALAKELGRDDLDKFVSNGKINTGVIADAERKSVYLDEFLQGWEEKYRKDLTPIIKNKAKLEKAIADKLAKDAKAYKEMKESDGAAFITFDAYRTLKFQGDNWSPAQEELYQKIIAGEEIDPLKVKEFFPIYKLHYYGAIANAPIATTAMHKFAVAPIIPTLAIKGTQMYNLHVKMLENNLQYVTFGSGSKVSTLTMTGAFDDIFGDANQKSVSMTAPIKPNVIHLEYLKDVTKVASKLKKEISYPTQKRVLLLDGLFNVGEAINEASGETAGKYKAAVDNYTDVLTLDLLNKIGYELDKNTGSYVGKLDKFIELIRDELGAKEIPDHLIKLLDTTLAGNLTMDFSIHPEADTLEKIIVNRIQKSVITQKTKGEAMVQAPSTFYNGVWDSAFERDEAIRKNDELIKKYLGSNVLAFYRTMFDEEGNRLPTAAMKVAIPLNGDFINLLNLKHPDGEPIGTRDRLNDLVKNDAWLEENRDLITIAGPRIPTDAANTMEFAEVWHFIDPAQGNTVIVPTEIVAKAGSDFDVDKIYFLMPNINSDGTLAKAPAESMEELTALVAASNKTSKKERKEKGLMNPQALIDQYKKAAQNKLIESTKAILSLPDNYASLTKPNNTYLVEDEVEFYDKYAKGYNNKVNAHGEAPRKNGKAEVMSPTKIFDVEYNLSVHESNLSGGLPLGIMAKKNKVHSLFKSIGAIMPKSYKATVWNDETKRYDELDAEYDVVIRMKHNKTRNAKGQEVVSLSNENNVDGEKIGDIFSHGLQGLLDRAKNPFPFKLQIVKEALSTINHLIESGVSVPETFAFINNPWIVRYIEYQMRFGGSTAKFMSEPILKHQVKSAAMRQTLQDFIKLGGVNMEKFVSELADTANELRLADVIAMLKTQDKSKKYNVILKEFPNDIFTTTVEDLVSKKGVKLKSIILLKEVNPNKSFELQKTIYAPSKGITNNDNFYYAAQVAWEKTFGNTDINESELKALVQKGDYPSRENLAVLLHMIQLEKQFSGMDALEMAFSPDTGLLDTTLQVKKRDQALKMFEESSKIDEDFLNRLRYDSILSSFYKSDMIMDLVVPLFSLRLNDQISNFIEKKLSLNKDIIAQKYGPGVKGQEKFINSYNNAVVNYIFQNTMSNYPDETGNPVLLPDTLHTFPVTQVETGPAVILNEKGFRVNLKKAEEDYRNKIFLTTNNTDESYAKTDQDTFTPRENPFRTFASYLKFITEKEYLSSIYPNETDVFLTQRALMNNFNRAFIMGTTKYSYTNMVMDIISEFEGQNIKENFPVLSQLAPAKFVKEVNVIELNDKATAKGVIAEDYYKNIKQLADPTVRKVTYADKAKQKADNKRISDVFKNFSLMMFYQHGTGYSRLGFGKILDPESFVEIMQNASNSFLNNSLSDETFERIYNRFITKSQFKDYTIDPSNPDATESMEDILSEFSEEDLIEMGLLQRGEQKPTGAPVSTDKFAKKNIFTVTPIQAADKKAVTKASIATQFIGFGEGITGSSTETYRQQAGELANTGNYSADDVIFVSIGGKRGTEVQEKTQQDRTIKEAIKAVEAGATILTDNKAYTDASSYNTGEKRLYANMESKGYNYSEVTVDGQVIGTWSKATTQPTVSSNVQVISPDYGVVQVETNPTDEKTKEFINLIRPQIQVQTYKENKGRFANEMFHYGLMWARNNPKAQPIKINKFEGANNNYYNYHALDQKGNALPSIKVLQPIIDEIQKSLGIDMSNYDSVIGNIYLDDQYVYPHKDTTESVTARNYPVVVYTIGNDSGLGIVDDSDGKMTFTNNYDTVYLPSGDKLKGYTNEILTKNGSIYTFGMDGKGRFELTHSTPTNSKKTEPFPPITLPNGKVVTNYTITLTFRRAADLEPGMPTAPAKLSTQSTAVQTAAATPLDKINEFYNGLTQEQKDKLGNLDDIIAEYNDVPFDYPVENYIESIKCKL